MHVDPISYALDMMVRDFGKRIRAWANRNGMLEMVDGRAAVNSINYCFKKDGD